jgi:hypothetical protein
MATTSDGRELTVFKFHETGLVALCEEVADLVASGQVEKWGYDRWSATYRDTDREHQIVFTKKEE